MNRAERLEMIAASRTHAALKPVGLDQRKDLSVKRRSILGAAIAVVATLSVSGSAFAASAPKTTGDVWADRTAEGLGMAHMVFVAQGGGDSAKGTFTYSDDKGAYTIAVQAVEVGTKDAHFAGPIVSHTYPGFQDGWYVGIAVHDGGEPGVGVDKINGSTYSSLADAVAGFRTLSPDYLTASAGNVQVK
jgi:hypothetical protein